MIIYHSCSYFLGLATFLFIVDFVMVSTSDCTVALYLHFPSFQSITGGGSMTASFINVLIVTAIVTYRAPSCIAVSATRSDKIREKIAQRNVANDPVNAQPTEGSIVSAQSQSGIVP